MLIDAERLPTTHASSSAARSRPRALLDGARSRALRYLVPTALVVDAAAVTGAGALALLGRDHLGLFEPAAQTTAENVGWMGPLIVGAWLLTLFAAGAYSRSVFGLGTDEYKRVLHASLLVSGLVGVTCYVTSYPLSRGFFLSAFVIGIPLLITGRFTIRRALYLARSRGALRQRVVIAGTPAHVDEVASVLRRESWLGYEVVGALIPGHVPQQTLGGVAVLGTPDDLPSTIASARADVVFVAGGALDSSGQLRRIVWELEDEAVQVIVAPSVTDVSTQRVKVRPVGGLPLIHIDKPRGVRASRLGKRAFDVVGSAALLVASAPLLVTAALIVRFHDHGPALFTQQRIGRDGRTFRCLKLRTMCPDAEDRLAHLHTAAQHTSGLFKLAQDPRVTRPGRWLRRYSIDELPQLVNVLRGEMSLVGPRPPLPAEVASYTADALRRLQVRPGMTGLWQVSGRSDLAFDEAIRLDLYYVDNWSMLQDIAIIGRTVVAVTSARGAY